MTQCGCPDVLNYAILFEGGGGMTRNISNDTVNGNIGIGGIGKFHADSSRNVINGRLDFAAPNTGQDQKNGATGPSRITFGGAQVQTDLNLINALSATLGAEPDTNVAISVGNGATQASANKETLYGIFLNPNGNIQLSSTNFVGRLLGGDSQNWLVRVPEPGMFAPLSAFATGLVSLGALVRTRRWLRRWK